MKHILILLTLTFGKQIFAQKNVQINNGQGSAIQKTSPREANEINIATVKKLDSLFDILAANNKAIGSFALRQNGKLVYSKATGFSNAATEENTPMPTTIYRIGSVTKMYTAAIIFKLIEQGLLNLQTPLSTFYSTIPSADKITIRQMLGHKSGIFNITADSSFKQWYTNPVSKSEMILKLEKHLPVFEPGTSTQYSNSNFILLGYIIEKITGQSYNDNLVKYINKVTGASRTNMTGKKFKNNKETASFSFENGVWEKEKETDLSIPQGAGSILATADEVALFAEHYVSGKIINQSLTDTVLNVARQLGYGIIKFDVEDETGYGHNGAIDGFNTEVIYFPKQKTSICFLSNGINYSINEIMRAAFCIIQQKPYTIPSFKTITLSDEELQKLDGEYSSDKIDLKIKVSHKGGVLYIQPTGQPLFAMDAESTTDFSNGQIGVALEFTLNADNTVKEMLLKQGGGTLAFKK